MKVGIDLKPFFTGSKYRGIGNYTRELFKALLQLDSDTEYHCLNLYGEYSGDPEMDARCQLYEYYTGPGYIDVGERQLLATESTRNIIKAEVQHFINQSKIDVMLFTSPNEYGNIYDAEWFEGIYKVGILYDLIPLIFPEQCLFDKLYKEDYEASLKFIKSLDLLLAISQSAKDDAVKLLGIPEEKIKVVYAGIDQQFTKLEKVNLKELKQRYGITDSFMMFAGGIDFKKNIEGLITAYSKLPRNIINKNQLVITGKANKDILQKYLDIAKESGVDGRVICTGFVPKDDLIALYNTTELLVFPSLYEGFGLPVIEAMACGARVVTSNVSSLKEIAENHALLINPKSIKSITKGIATMFEHPVEALELAERSVDYAKSFTWERVARLTLAAICERPSSDLSVQNYSFTVQDKDLENIAKAYADCKILLTPEEQQRIADELIALEDHIPKLTKKFKNRLLYDVTVVREWLTAGYTTGIARVSVELYKRLQNLNCIIPVVIHKKNMQVYVNAVKWNTWEITEENITLKNTDIYIMPELQLRGIQVDKNHPGKDFLRSQGIKCYAMLYDILPLRRPQYFEEKTCKAFAPYVKELINDYDGILCDSKWVAEDVIKYCHENNLHPDKRKNRVGFFHLGPNSFERKPSQRVDRNIRVFMETAHPIFVMIGTIEPRKGHKLVLQTFEKLWAKGFDGRLCFAGHVGWNMMPFIDHVKGHAKKGTMLEFFEAVNDTELEYIYEHANALIQASYGEGYGLPLIEAGHYGIPIICSDIEVFHEVAEDHATYFAPDDEASLYATILSFSEKLDNMPCDIPDSSKITYATWEDAALKVHNMICDDKEWYGEI